ncbi:hypothetical protein CFELI_05295 [Corynebacterium felinum]|uniref:Transposase n=1 Tax=Corynebacterium felinum TaxID=131318 RepID=A0ABU2B9Q1_9CORY|nr:hypothetical protein [Corynebacterium felinum]WJY94687.1 hypothetical protein CFELI_05295 [Corynebacterium felinum]
MLLRGQKVVATIDATGISPVGNADSPLTR